MTVFFIAPLRAVAHKISLYRQIVRTIHAGGHSLERNWLEPAFYRPDLLSGIGNEQETVKEIFRAITASDVVIFDVSDNATFGLGYLAAVAQAQGKPLFLFHEKNTEQGLLPRTLDDVQYVDFESSEEREGIKSFSGEC